MRELPATEEPDDQGAGEVVAVSSGVTGRSG
jgi:hypothetical protein